MSAHDIRTPAGRDAWALQFGVSPLCGLVFSDRTARGCRLEFGHAGRCDARLGEAAGWRWPAADPLAAGERRDEELWREER